MSNDIRRYITLIESMSAPQPLMEASLRDTIKGAASRLSQKYGDLKYQVLAAATTKALGMFNQNQQVSGTVQRILRVGKLAAQNRALIAILIGMVGTLIGYAHNPAAAAKMAQQMDASLNGHDLDEIINNLAQHGINIDHGAMPADITSILHSLPQQTASVVEKAARALKGIADFKYEHGAQIESHSQMSFMVDGMVNKEQGHYESDIWCRTSDGQMVLSHMHTESTETNGVSHIEDSADGVEFQLQDYLGKLPRDQQIKIIRYFDGFVLDDVDVDGAAPAAAPASGVDTSQLMSMLKDKSPGFTAMVSTALAAKPDGRYRVVIGPKGTTVTSA